MKVGRMNIVLLNVILIVTLAVSVNDSVWNEYYCQASPVSCETPKVVLQNGTAGTSTIYTNNTCATISVAARNWWNIDYDYRKQISIVNNVESTLGSGYSVCLTVNTSSLVSKGKMLSNGNDLRIVYWNSIGQSNVELDRINETNFNTPSTEVWFKAQANISASGYDDNYYVYYGNPSATSPPANGSSVYLFFDDYNQPDNGPGASYTIEGGTWRVVSNELRQTTAAGYVDIFITILTSETDYITTNKWRPETGSNTDSGPIVRASAAQNSLYLERRSGGAYLFKEPEHNQLASAAMLSPGTSWHEHRVEVLGNNYRFYEDDILYINYTGSPLPLSSGAPGLATYYDALPYHFDDLKVRKYVSPEPSTSLGSEERNVVDYVDNNASDIGPPTDKGTHSNFTAQQYGPDSIHDTLTEEDTLGSWGNYSSELLINPGAEFGNTTGWTATGPNAANFVAGYDCPSGSAGPHTGSYTFYWNNPSSSSDWAYQEIDLSPWLSGIQSGEVQIMAKGWLVCSEYNVPPWDIVRMRVVFYNSSSQEISSDTYDTGERGDLQNWTEFGIENYTIPTSAVKARVWFQTYENNWDAGNADDFTVKVRTFRNYELDLEVQWAGVNYSEENEVLCIYGGTMGAEDIRVDVRNGSKWETLFNDLSSGWNNISVSSYLISSNFTIRFKGGSETSDTNQDSWNIDATLLHIWTFADITYDYVLRITSTVTDSWEIRLKKYSDSNINRLQNCTIYFHNSTNGVSGQIRIENGNYTLGGDVGSWYDLHDSETIYIAMAVQTNSTGTSYVRTYLEIRIPGTSTYNLYVITFEIT